MEQVNFVNNFDVIPLCPHLKLFVKSYITIEKQFKKTRLRIQRISYT